MAATSIGAIKGVLGLSQTITGIVLESTDFDFPIEKLPFTNQEGETTSVAYVDPTVSASLKGRLINGTAFTGNLATTLTLSSVPVYAGNPTTAKFIIENVKIGEAKKDYRSIELALTHYPYVTIP